MRVLIVESKLPLATLWSRHLERMGVTVTIASGQEEAVNYLHDTCFNVIIMNIMLEEGSALAVADYTGYRWPDTKVIIVNDSSFFSDGSIFQHVGNACTMVPVATRPEDLAAMAQHYAIPDSRMPRD